MADTKTFKCGCGKFKATLTGQPKMNLNWHCHSCVSSARFIDENHGKENNGISNIDDTGGAALSMYKLAMVAFPDDNDPRESLGCVKVGDKGEMLRYYTKCCGTAAFVTSTKGTNPGFNRNAIYEGDGGSDTKFVPNKTPLNIMTKYCFGAKEDIPDPKTDMVTPGVIMSFIPFVVSTSMGFGRGKNKFATRKEDLERAEVVPITWE